MLSSDLCDYSDASFVLKVKTTVQGDNDGNARNKQLNFKNKSTFRSCISKINNISTDNAVNLDLVMQMYNLLKNTVKIILWHQEVCGNIIEMK